MYDGDMTTSYTTHLCPFCKTKSYEKLISLSLHCRKTHKKTAKEFYTELVHNGVVPVCACGCGQETKFLDIGRGFSQFIQGHSSRVHNNFQTEKSKTNSIKTRRKMLEAGSWKPFHEKETGEHWALGKTKETDARIAKMSQTVMANPKERERRSALFKQLREDGVIKILYGPEASRWKGGTSPLLSVCHANSRLYQEWKYPKLLAAKFSCEGCKISREAEPRPNLEVHHNQVRMSTIVRLVAESNGWNDAYAVAPAADKATVELKHKISEAVADYHIRNNVPGIVLCEQCHKNQHDKHNL